MRDDDRRTDELRQDGLRVAAKRTQQPFAHELDIVATLSQIRVVDGAEPCRQAVDRALNRPLCASLLVAHELDHGLCQELIAQQELVGVENRSLDAALSVARRQIAERVLGLMHGIAIALDLRIDFAWLDVSSRRCGAGAA